MDQKLLNRSEFSERYIITDMVVFTLCATMIILLILDCLRIYSQSKFESLTYLRNMVDNIESQLSNGVDQAILKIMLYEEKIINYNKQQNLGLITQQIESDDKNFYFFPTNLKGYESTKIKRTFNENFQIKKDKKDAYILLNQNGLFVCKNIIINNILLGVGIEKVFIERSYRKKNINDISEFLISDGYLSYKVIERGYFTKKIRTEINNFKKSNNFIHLWADIVTGENIGLRKFDDSLFIQIQLDRNFIKGKIYRNFLSRFIEISSFSIFFLILIILIIRKDRERSIYTETLKQKAINANKAKSDFLAYTAHEIRSPLGFILTGTDMIKAGLFGPISDKCNEYIEGINLNAKSILNFITEILDESKILQNKFSLERNFYDITKIILEVIKHNKTKFYSKKIDIITDFQDNIPLLYCDDKKIYQVINNLVTNSCKYSKENIWIKIKAFIDNKKLFLIIEDNGIGMDDEEIKIAIKKYEFMNSNKGTDSYGLGLFIVKLLLDAHEAKFYITSKKNIGTTATIIFNQKLLKN